MTRGLSSKQVQEVEVTIQQEACAPPLSFWLGLFLGVEKESHKILAKFWASSRSDCSKITKGGGWWTKERTGGGRGEEEQDGPTEATGECGARLVAQRVAQVLVAQRVAQVGRVQH